MPVFNLPHGKGCVRINIPDWVSCELIEPGFLPAIEDIRASIVKAVENPYGCPPLRDIVSQGNKVAIIVTDITRLIPDELIVSVLLDELLKAGIRYEDVKIILATGTHRPNTPAEIEEKLGLEIPSRVKVINHNAYDSSGLVNLGKSAKGFPIIINKDVTEADIRIATGIIESHLLAGYSGGVKSLAVGVAGEETIAATHNVTMLMHPSTRLAVIEGNVFREFLNEVEKKLKLHFIINVVKRGEKDVVRVMAGHPIAAFEEGVKTAREISEVSIDKPADIVITTSGYPKDRDLYQATRAANSVCFSNKPAIKKGGIIIIPAPCQDGIGHEGFGRWMRRFKDSRDLIQALIEEDFAPGEQKAFIIAKILEQARIVITDTILSPDTISDMHMQYHSTVQEAFDKALEEKGEGAHIMIAPYGLQTLPVLS